MSVIAAPFVRARPARWSLTETAAFAAAVFMILTYSEGWLLPLSGGGDEAADSALIRILFLPAYAAGIGLMALTPANTLRGVARQPFLVVIFAIAAVSVVWSVSPDQTQRRVFALAFTTLGGVVLAARYSWARLAEVLGAAFLVLALCSLITGLFVPSIGRMSDIFPGAWRGLWEEKNTFGDNMAQGGAICAAAALLNPKRGTLWWCASVLCFFLLLMSTSKTSLVAALLSVVSIGLIWSVRRGPAASVAATWTALVAIGAAGAVMFFASDQVFGLLGKDATLTGRTKIWAAVMRQINERPWQGFGYGAIWEETDRWGPLAWITHDAGFRARHAHNSWLEQWLSLGLPGLAAWAGFYLQTLVANIVALYRHKGAFLALPLFVLFSLTSLTESIAVLYNDMRWVIFVALAVKLSLPDPAAGPTRRPQRAPTLVRTR